MTGSSIFCSNLRNRRSPSYSNYHMSTNNRQAIQKSCIYRKSNAWVTLGSESKTLVSLGRSRFSNYYMIGSPSLGNRASWSCTSYLTICQLRSFKRSKKNYLQDYKIVTPEPCESLYSLYMISSLDSLNSDCRSFSSLNVKKKQRSCSLSRV